MTHRQVASRAAAATTAVEARVVGAAAATAAVVPVVIAAEALAEIPGGQAPVVEIEWPPSQAAILFLGENS